LALSDIPHCLLHFCEYSAVESFIRHSALPLAFL
jgi:hypothetical protein